MSPPRIAIADIYSTVEQPPNAEQRAAIENVDGPMRIIAGPGSGKTHVLVLRTLNLIACHEVDPGKVVVVTFTEKAAAELEARIRLHASRLQNGANLQLAELNVGTIHWFCGSVLRRYHPDLRRFEPLDDLGQQLFVYDNLDDITDGLKVGRNYLGKWASKSTAVKQLIAWFSKVTEETLRAEQLAATGDPFLEQLSLAYTRYHGMLRESGFLDFSFILRELHDLLEHDESALLAAQERFGYFMVDEYQDTNYVQEAVLFDLAAPEYNIAVVGDDDQSLYRFRGAEVRNILEFPERLQKLAGNCTEVGLTVNYRSHPAIIASYLNFMGDGDWTKNGETFRTGHDVFPDPSATFRDYPATMHWQGGPRQIADLVARLIADEAVADPSHIAVLFHSVSGDGQEVLDLLHDRGIPTYAPRARRYLDRLEVRLSVAVLWEIAGFPDGEGPDGGAMADLLSWAQGCARQLREVAAGTGLLPFVDERRSAFQDLQPGEDLDASLLDLFYRAFGFEPFSSLLDDHASARNLAHFTVLLRTFQQQFRFEVLHAGVKTLLPWRLWAAFMYLLRQQGVEEVPDEQEIPRGFVQVMTIHQAKGLEFPVVVVGSLHRRPSSGKAMDNAMGSLYPRGLFEPQDRITEFDARREAYVALSRAQDLLITFSDGAHHKYFDGLVGRTSVLSEAGVAQAIASLPDRVVETTDLKPVLSLTSHINVFRRCPRQFRFFREFEFAPSFAAQIFFGTVVHQTIEDIHRHILDGRPEALTTDVIDGYFARNSELLRKRGVHPLAPKQREEARKHVQRYFDANSDSLDQVIDTEVEVTLEKDRYLLNGRIDLIKGSDGEIEMVDFKAQKRTVDGDEYEHYRDQLALYESLLEQRYGVVPKRAVLYFTGEDDAKAARVVVDLDKTDVEEVVARFDRTASEILGKNFELVDFPSRDTCRACDFKHHCHREGEDGDAA